MRLRQVGLAVAILTLVCVGFASAQSTTATVSGHVTDSQGLALPGVTVAVASPSLQGIRTTVTSEFGDYAISLLPPGTYTLTFELAGFRRQELKAVLAPPRRCQLTPRSVRPPLPRKSPSSARRRMS
jgi:hypothetical protein